MEKLNRTIEFKGLRKDGKGWAYGVPFHIHEEDKCFIIDNCMSGTLEQDSTEFTGLEVVPSTVGQYIGREDSTGVSIYEGDEVKYLGAEGCVIYLEELAMFMINFYKPNVSSYAFDNVDDYIKVVGNIHEGGKE